MHRFCLSLQAEGTSGKLPFPSEAPKLFGFFAIILHYITSIATIFPIICIIPKTKNRFLGWNSLQITGQMHHPTVSNKGERCS
jgi:hypothetical protein